MQEEKEFKNNEQALTILITEFRLFKEQDSKDKAQIRNDIKELKDNLASRVDTLEMRKLSFEDFKLHREEILKGIDRLQITVYGPNKDGKGGGASKIIELNDSVKTIWKILAVYTSILTPILSFIIYILYEHIKGVK